MEPFEDTTNYDAYLALKKWHPSMMSNLEACVDSGAAPNEILEKCKDFTPADVPDFVWQCIEMALNHLMLERNARNGMN